SWPRTSRPVRSLASPPLAQSSSGLGRSTTGWFSQCWARP
uniref:TAO kinase 3 n=1 Tax=Taeniopygia guttata TaxID=59729 RepID=A0A674HQR2_TAEGU